MKTPKANQSTPLTRPASSLNRTDFLPHHFGRFCVTFEHALASRARLCITNYRGCYWEFAHGPGDLPILYPRGDQPLEVQTIFATEARPLTPLLAGLYISSLAVLALLEKADQLGMSDEEHDQFCEMHRSLLDLGRDIAAQNNCANDWFALVD